DQRVLDRVGDDDDEHEIVSGRLPQLAGPEQPQAEEDEQVDDRRLGDDAEDAGQVGVREDLAQPMVQHSKGSSPVAGWQPAKRTVAHATGQAMRSPATKPDSSTRPPPGPGPDLRRALRTLIARVVPVRSRPLSPPGTPRAYT